jgi:soluble P-type ATPase
MLEIATPSRNVLRLRHLVLDMNGTIALDGQLVPGVSERLETLGERLGIWLVSADTQGTLASLATSLQVQARRLQPGDEAAQDVIAPDIGTALDLLLRPRRLIATLRT